MDVKSVSELVEIEKSPSRRPEERNSPYQELIGKISETRSQIDFARVSSSFLSSLQNMSKLKTKKKKKNFEGVCDFSCPISNPLYKIYDPQGYKKTEEEVAKEHIEKIVKEFNEWLTSLEGNLVQLDLQHLTKILGQELIIPTERLSPIES